MGLLFTLISFHNYLLRTLCLDKSEEKIYSFIREGVLGQNWHRLLLAFFALKKKHCVKLIFEYCVDNRSLQALRSRGVHSPVPYFKVLMSASSYLKLYMSAPLSKENSVPLPQGLDSLPFLPTSRSGWDTLPPPYFKVWNSFISTFTLRSE